MPFVRFTRDKRGYEHVYLVHEAGRRGKASRPRILYWYRTPPGIRVGREPFDDAVRRQLEAQNPDVSFDWQAIRSAQPPPDVEHWRERRRAEKAAKVARRAEEVAEPGEPSEQINEAEQPGGQLEAVQETEAEVPADDGAGASAGDDEIEGAQPPAAAAANAEAPGQTSERGDVPGRPRKRRRRRGRRRGAPGAPVFTPAGAEAPGSDAVKGEPEDVPTSGESDASED